MKDYNVMMYGRNYSVQTRKNDSRTYGNIQKVATGQGDDYTTGYLLR